MKEPGSEIKAKFFALYYGQSVLQYQNHTIHPIVDCNVLDESRNNLKHSFLHLRTVDQLTDEESILVAKLQSQILQCVGWDIKVTRNLREPVTVWGFAKDEQIRIGLNEWSLNMACIDYLRSIGIILPFTYTIDNQPHTASISTLLEWGWVKTK